MTPSCKSPNTQLPKPRSQGPPSGLKSDEKQLLTVFPCNTRTIFKLGGLALHAINDSFQHARGLKSPLCSDEELTPKDLLFLYSVIVLVVSWLTVGSISSRLWACPPSRWEKDWQPDSQFGWKSSLSSMTLHLISIFEGNEHNLSVQIKSLHEIPVTNSNR